MDGRARSTSLVPQKDYAIADIDLADFGRAQIASAETQEHSS